MNFIWSPQGTKSAYLEKNENIKVSWYLELYHATDVFGQLLEDIKCVSVTLEGEGYCEHHLPTWHTNTKRSNLLICSFHNSQGEEWYRIRSLLDKKLLSPTECNKFFDPLNIVTGDYINNIEHVRDTEGDEVLAKSLPYESYKWGVECKYAIVTENECKIFNVTSYTLKCY
jgi:hypothetical protein